MVCPDFNILNSRNNRILQELQKNPWISDVYSSLSDTSMESDFIPDTSRMKGTGINPAMVAADLQTYASGVQASTVVTGGLSYPIQVQADPTTLSGVQSLVNLPLYSPLLQTTIQVGQLGTFVMNQAPVTLSRYNRQYTGNLTITMTPDAPPPLTVMNRVTADLKRPDCWTEGMSITTNNRFNQVALAQQLLVTGPLTFLLAFFLAYLVMAAQFNSWRYPIYLLLPGAPCADRGPHFRLFHGRQPGHLRGPGHADAHRSFGEKRHPVPRFRRASASARCRSSRR